MKKTLSIVLAALMLLCCIPFTASAAITLSRSNIEVIPPTVTPNEVKYGEGCANVTVTGGQLWYIDENGTKTEVKGYFDIRNKATLNPINTGVTSLTLLFYPEDTETYGTVSSSLRNNTTVVSGEWPTIYIRGDYTEIVTPPTFTCYAGDNLLYYTNYTKSGGKVVDANGTDVTSSGQFYIDGAKNGGENQYLYEDKYITARWDGNSKSGYESSYYENVLVKVTKKTASLTTAPTIPDVLVGTTYGEAMAQLTAKVLLTGSSSSYDNANTYWVPTYPEGCNADTPITEDVTFTVSYQNPATDDTFSSEVTVDVYTKPIAEITTAPTAENAKAGMKASELVLTGGVASCDGTFTVADAEQVLSYGANTVKLIFTPSDLTAYDGTVTEIEVVIDGIVTENPTLDATGLYAGAKVSEVALNGGTASVDGIFAFETPEQKLGVGTNFISVIFTPTDTSVYPQKLNLSVSVKGKIAFVDDDGNAIVPEVTVEYYNTKINNLNLSYYLKEYTNLTDADGVSFNFRDLDGKDFDFAKDYLTVGTRNLKVTAYAQNKNYEKAVLDFVLTVVPKPVKISIKYTGTEIVVSRTNTDTIKGTFELYCDGEKLAEGLQIAGAQSSLKYAWSPETSSVHTIKAVYVPITNDTMSIETVETELQVNLQRQLSVPDGSGYGVKVNGSKYFATVQCGDDIELDCMFDDFVEWIITDNDGNPVDLGTVYTQKTVVDDNGGITFETVESDLTAANISFKMPDRDINVAYKTQAMLDEELKQAAIDDCDCLCHYNNPIAKLIWKLVNFFCKLFGVNKDCACGYAVHY